MSEKIFTPRIYDGKLTRKTVDEAMGNAGLLSVSGETSPNRTVQAVSLYELQNKIYEDVKSKVLNNNLSNTDTTLSELEDRLDDFIHSTPGKFKNWLDSQEIVENYTSVGNYYNAYDIYGDTFLVPRTGFCGVKRELDGMLLRYCTPVSTDNRSVYLSNLTESCYCSKNPTSTIKTTKTVIGDSSLYEDNFATANGYYTCACYCGVCQYLKPIVVDGTGCTCGWHTPSYVGYSDKISNKRETVYMAQSGANISPTLGIYEATSDNGGYCYSSSLKDVMSNSKIIDSVEISYKLCNCACWENIDANSFENITGYYQCLYSKNYVQKNIPSAITATIVDLCGREKNVNMSRSCYELSHSSSDNTITFTRKFDFSSFGQSLMCSNGYGIRVSLDAMTSSDDDLDMHKCGVAISSCLTDSIPMLYPHVAMQSNPIQSPEIGEGYSFEIGQIKVTTKNIGVIDMSNECSCEEKYDCAVTSSNTSAPTDTSQYIPLPHNMFAKTGDNTYTSIGTSLFFTHGSGNYGGQWNIRGNFGGSSSILGNFGLFRKCNTDYEEIGWIGVSGYNVLKDCGSISVPGNTVCVELTFQKYSEAYPPLNDTCATDIPFNGGFIVVPHSATLNDGVSELLSDDELYIGAINGSAAISSLNVYSSGTVCSIPFTFINEGGNGTATTTFEQISEYHLEMVSKQRIRNVFDVESEVNTFYAEISETDDGWHWRPYLRNSTSYDSGLFCPRSQYYVVENPRRTNGWVGVSVTVEGETEKRTAYYYGAPTLLDSTGRVERPYVSHFMSKFISNANLGVLGIDTKAGFRYFDEEGIQKALSIKLKEFSGVKLDKTTIDTIGEHDNNMVMEIPVSFSFTRDIVPFDDYKLVVSWDDGSESVTYDAANYDSTSSILRFVGVGKLGSNGKIDYDKSLTFSIYAGYKTDYDPFSRKANMKYFPPIDGSNDTVRFGDNVRLYYYLNEANSEVEYISLEDMSKNPSTSNYNYAVFRLEEGTNSYSVETPENVDETNTNRQLASRPYAEMNVNNELKFYSYLLSNGGTIYARVFDFTNADSNVFLWGTDRNLGVNGIKVFNSTTCLVQYNDDNKAAASDFIGKPFEHSGDTVMHILPTIPTFRNLVWVDNIKGMVKSDAHVGSVDNRFFHHVFVYDENGKLVSYRPMYITTYTPIDIKIRSKVYKNYLRRGEHMSIVLRENLVGDIVDSTTDATSHTFFERYGGGNASPFYPNMYLPGNASGDPNVAWKKIKVFMLPEITYNGQIVTIVTRKYSTGSGTNRTLVVIDNGADDDTGVSTYSLTKYSYTYIIPYTKNNGSVITSLEQISASSMSDDTINNRANIGLFNHSLDIKLSTIVLCAYVKQDDPSIKGWTIVGGINSWRELPLYNEYNEETNRTIPGVRQMVARARTKGILADDDSKGYFEQIYV